MQKRGRALKVDLIIEGNKFPGLNTFGGLKGEKGELDVGENGFIYPIFDGQIKYPPIEGGILDQNDNGAEQFLRDWFEKHEVHDVTYVEQDGHGTEIRRIILPDSENGKYESVDFDAGGVAVALVLFKFAFYRPIFL